MSKIIESGIVLDENSPTKTFAITKVISPSSTEEIVSGYENKINHNISIKVLESSKSGKLPIFTNEEKAYLQKKSIDVTQQIEVITADPPITLKKGNTEINIKNAASLVKRMDKVFSSPKSPIEKAVEIENLEELKDQTIKELITNSPVGVEYQKNRHQGSGKNAYEIRSDILKMANDLISQNGTIKVSAEEVLDVAKKFYSFVENRKYN